jgi:hypothetical protein
LGLIYAIVNEYIDKNNVAKEEMFLQPSDNNQKINDTEIEINNDGTFETCLGDNLANSTSNNNFNASNATNEEGNIDYLIEFCNLCLLEMISRVLKNILRNKWRQIIWSGNRYFAKQQQQ